LLPFDGKVALNIYSNSTRSVSAMPAIGTLPGPDGRH
jgi:hypothetical protein